MGQVHELDRIAHGMEKRQGIDPLVNGSVAAKGQNHRYHHHTRPKTNELVTRCCLLTACMPKCLIKGPQTNENHQQSCILSRP